MDIRIKKTMDNLKKNNFDVKFFNDFDEAKKHILNEIGTDVEIGIGGSMTIFDAKLHEDLINRGNKVFWHWLVDTERRQEIRSLAANTPVYMSSTNAITEDGKLINIDGVGNRVASMFYGHDKVYIIAGINKITKNIDEAILRIKRNACPPNARRLDLDTPCRHTGECNDCSSKQRMCNVTVTLEKSPMKENIKVYIINEVLGY